MIIGETEPPPGVCSWAEAHPFSCARTPQWSGQGMCAHEHQHPIVLCGPCKQHLEIWQQTYLVPMSPWCGPCYTMRPGGHHCTVQVVITPLAEEG